MQPNKHVAVRCYESHPPLKLSDGLVIYGGSCLYPAVKDADVYVGLDYGMQTNHKAYPWEPGYSFLYPITDMKAPDDPASFSDMIDWLIVQLTANAKVHVGCIGGHGRTGTVLSALVARMMGEKDAIEYVRKNYCHKAVESQAQVSFLMKHYGVNAAHGAKEYIDLPKTARQQSLDAYAGYRDVARKSSVTVGVGKSIWSENVVVVK